MSIFHKRLFFFLTFCAAVLFFFFRVDTFDLPFFWDEAWVYGPAVKTMGNQWCFLPSCAGDLSRGHPLLFHFIGGCWIKSFGDSLFSLHAFAFTLSTILFFSCFFVGYKLFGPLEGFFVAVATISQNLIFGQSAMVYPEILLAFFTLWTIYFFLRNRIFLFLISGFLLCLVKEQGVVIVAAVFLWQIIRLVRIKGIGILFSKEIFKSFSFFLIQISGLFLFFLVQKIQKDYWLFPEHLQLIQTSGRNVLYQAKLSFHQLFFSDGRFLFTLSFLLLFLIKGKISPAITRFFLFGIMVLSTILFSGWLSIPLSCVLIFCSITFYFVIIRFLNSFDEQPLNSSLFGLLYTVIGMYIIFCAFNFFTLRYLACLVPVVMLLFTGYLHSCGIKSTARYLISFFLIISSFYFLFSNNSIGDVATHNHNAIRVQQNVINEMMKRNLSHDTILATFVMNNNMKFQQAGFVPSDQYFSKATNYLFPETPFPKYVLYFNFEHDSMVDSFLGSHRKRYENIYVAQSQWAKGYIFKLKK